MTTQAEKEMFEAIGIKPICPFRNDRIKCPATTIDSCDKCHIPKSYPPITAEIREKIWKIILNKYTNFRIDTDTNTNEDGFQYQIEVYEYAQDKANRYFGIGNIFSNALCNLVIQLPEIWKEIKEIF